MNKLEKIYEEIDNDNYYVNNYNLYYISKKFEVLLCTKSDIINLSKDEIKYCKIERECFHINIKNYKPIPLISTSDKNGNIAEYPNFQEFTNEMFEYILKRAEKTNSPLLKSHYYHLLWISPIKTRNNAINAINYYLILFDNIIESRFYRKKLEYLLIVFELAISIKNNIETIVDKIIYQLQNANKDFEISYRIYSALIPIILDKKNYFKKEHLEIIFENIIIFSNHLEATKNYSNSSLQILEIIQKLCYKLNKKVDIYKEKLAILYENLAIEENSGYLKKDYYSKAIILYKELKNNLKIEELGNKIINLKKTTNEFSNYYEELIIDWNYINTKIDNLLKLNTNQIIYCLINNKDIIPNLEQVEKIISHKKVSVLDFISLSILDINDNTAKHFNTDEEKLEHDRCIVFKELLIETFAYTSCLMINLIKYNKISIQDILIYFRNNTWFGKNLLNESYGKKYEYNWLNLLIPTLNEYFNQIYLLTINSNIKPNFILCIDSLTLKFEGIIRDICKIIGITTTYFSNDKFNNPTESEKDINQLLRESKLAELINKDDLFFLKFLLISKDGFNLRNDIAHSFYKYEDYTFYKANLLFLALLKISKYDFVKNKN